ncbi:hypothetical protein IV203_032629 [Nitzschia inconspicua]|uniref:Uncharacterized protein n=1 Tax=Nitzschia inconspicua TaxID=303405 RepID=A0A9K3KJZ5_9STRA|nr:hypothetical protein IV203_032629 [Nitzschia inconspicua]
MTILYVVQRCWHSGPQQYEPLDFLRLFHTQRDAEEAAYHSAHAWSKHIHNGRDVPIKTLLLPSYPDHNPQGSSYGFIASGTLFWVRALKATMVSARHHNRVFDDRNNYCHSAAYAIVTEGVIGGTGNRNSRRGTEVCEGRVFGGDASSHKWAMEALQQVKAGFQAQGYSRTVEVKLLAIGKPDEYSSGVFLKDWPPQVLQPNVSAAAMVDLHALHKRQFEDDDYWETQEEEGMVVDCPFEAPSAKRRRFETTVTPTSSMGDSTLDSNILPAINVQCNNSYSMFQGNGSGGLVVMRGGVFVGASTNNNITNVVRTSVGGSEDVAMM